MLDAVGICIAYVLGILWGLYLDINLGIVSFFLLLCVWLIKCFWKEAGKKKYRWIYHESKTKISGIWLVMIICFLIGILYTNIRKNDFENRYESGVCWMKGEILQKIEEGNYYNKYRFQNAENKNFLLYIPKEALLINDSIKENSIISFSKRKI